MKVVAFTCAFMIVYVIEGQLFIFFKSKTISQMTNPLSWGLLLACVRAYPIFIRLLGFLILVKPEVRLSSSFETPSLGAVSFYQCLKQAVGLQAVAL